MAVTVRQNLKFNMTGFFHKAFDIHGGIRKSLFRLTLRRLELGIKLLRRHSHTHTPAAAAGRRLDHDRIADLGSLSLSLFHIQHRLPAAGNHRYARFDHGISGLGFISHLFNDFTVWPDKLHAAFFAHAGKFAVLRKKAKSRMDGLRIHGDRRA